ncbi:MAG TPA: hypothetical protein VK797_11020 [Tepidisphaeraceae bacterium]|jgi:hypothetical protein|nr:hypothetical protein [Tepidisphaeraceae bacterium]
MERSPAVSKKFAKNVPFRPFRSKRSTSFRVTGNGGDTQIDRTTTVDFSDLGATTVEVPDDVKKKLEPPAQNP